VSRPKFQSKEARERAELEMEPLASPWSAQRQREAAEKFAASMPAAVRPYFDVDDAVRRRLGHQRHQAYLKRTGGNLRTEADDVSLMWTCCGRTDLLAEVHYDRRGELRPEDRARILGLSYYHQCGS
jgi:hypothetical protein